MECNQWVKCFSVVTFDEDIGQKVEFQTPLLMNDEQQQALAFLAFPDSNAFNSMGDLVYVFKMRFDPVLFGYVFFRQRRDLTRPRKFSQKSLVLLSEHPFISLFKQVVEIVGPLYFEHGETIFEPINSCIKSWGPVVPGMSRELPMLGVVVVFTVPSTDSAFCPQVLGDGLSDILDTVTLGHPGLFQDINLCEVLGMGFLRKHLWMFWEILISGEPLLFITDSPGTCSLGVLALVSLISPLIYSGDVHPYFTIFDSEFKSVQAMYEKKRMGDVVIGATNPYILKLFGELQNVFQFEENGGLQAVGSFPSGNIPAYRPLLIQLFESRTKENMAINNATIRRHFRELTLSFLHPFQQYLTMDMRSILESPFTQSNSLLPFIESEFIAHINNSKNMFPMLKYTTRPKAAAIYAKFIKSTTFNRWFASQRQKANGESDRVIRKAMFDFDVSKVFTMEKNERKMLCEKIRRRVMCEEKIGENLEGVNKLKRQLELLEFNIANLNGTV
jgi:hypothetical protein